MLTTQPSLDDRVRALGLATIDAIEWNGWCQGTNQDEEGRVCLDGAMCLASTNGVSVHSYVITNPCGEPITYGNPDAVEAFRARFIRVTLRSQMDWNDSPSRTREQVIWMVAEVIGADPKVVLYG